MALAVALGLGLNMIAFAVVEDVLFGGRARQIRSLTVAVLNQAGAESAKSRRAGETACPT
jgi:hypothetical protein